MNKIKGLILKDLLELKAYKKNFLLSIFIYIFIIVINANKADMSMIGTSMIVFLFGVYALATFNYDEKSNTDKYILTLGINRKDVIISKYIFVILSVIVGTLIGALLSVVLSFVNVLHIDNYGNIISSILGILYSMSIIHGIQIPCIYKYGAEKGRLQIYLIVMIIFLIFGGVYWLFSNKIIIILNKIEFVIPFIFTFLIFINYYISYKISYIIYQKKEL